MKVKRDILWRVYLSFLGIVLLSAMVVGRVIYIQQVQGNYWKSMSDSLHQRIEDIDAGRGTIYSEDRQMLSTSLPVFDIYIDFMADGLREKRGKRFIENIDSFSIAMATFFKDKEAAIYKRELKTAYKNKERYYLLKKRLSYQEYKVFRNFPLAKLGRNKSGIIVEESSRRLMPFGLLANRTIGLSREYVSSKGKIKKQNVGLENSYDTALTGQKGQRLVRFIAGGVAVPIDGYQIEPENGNDIITTLDVNIQDITSTALLKMMQQSESQYGTAIVMEAKSGKIKAIANLGKNSEGAYWEDDNYALKITEPGSTIKLATLMAVLEEKNISLSDSVEVGVAGKLFVGVRMVTDAERSPRHKLSVKECFAHSSNVGMSILANKTFASNPQKFKSYLHQYLLDVPSPIDLTNVGTPSIASFEKNRGGVMNMITASFGYAIKLSPLHTLTFYNAIANNGKMMKPYLVNKIESEGVLISNISPVVLHERIGSNATINAAKESMEAVVIEGTGKNVFNDLDFPVAGKTGTAHVADGKIKYEDGVYQASFVGYFPSNNPQYSCIVVIRTKPNAAIHYGGQLAAPVFKEVAKKLYASYVIKAAPSLAEVKRDSMVRLYTGVSSDFKTVLNKLEIPYLDSTANNNWSTMKVGKFQKIISANRNKEGALQNVVGMNLKDALYALESRGFEVLVQGKGKVIAQIEKEQLSSKQTKTILLILKEFSN